jgi:long-subunit acyl-CoA synthetase (AMP-forming)
MEMIAEVSMMAFGGALAYGSPHTLTDTSVKLKRPESSGDAIVAQPTFMVFAPAVFDKVYKVVLGRVQNAGGLKKRLFDKALDWGMQNFDNGGIGVNPLVNKIAFGPVQGLLGGKLKLAITGSAPLAPEIQKFMQTVLKCPVRQGYGLTENCACASIGTPADNSTGTVGPPQPCTVVRLADWPEGQYMNSDKKNPNIGMARGEVLVGGAPVSIGYFVDPENPDPEIQKKNEEEFVTIKGVPYFRTGDIGQITPSGCLMIIDRKKDLWKGPQGEYVSLSKVEAALKLSPLVEVPMVYGKTGGEFPIALLCVIESEIRKIALANSLDNHSIEELCTHETILAEVGKSCREKCKEMALVEFEVPKKFVLLPPKDGVAAWTPENDMLTNTMKLKRPVITREFQEQINKAYS